MSRSGSEPIETGFRTATDCRGAVLPVPVHSSRIFVINMTGSVPGSSQKGLRTGTRPDFKALLINKWHQQHQQTMSWCPPLLLCQCRLFLQLSHQQKYLICTLMIDQQQIMNLFRSQLQLALQYPPPTGIPDINYPGPSSHPRGPPNFKRRSAVAMQEAPLKL